jgi:hypothetical protein
MINFTLQVLKSQRRGPWYTLGRWLGGLQSWSRNSGEEENSRPFQKLNHNCVAHNQQSYSSLFIFPWQSFVFYFRLIHCQPNSRSSLVISFTSHWPFCFNERTSKTSYCMSICEGCGTASQYYRGYMVDFKTFVVSVNLLKPSGNFTCDQV